MNSPPYALDRFEHNGDVLLLQGWVLPCANKGAPAALALKGQAPDGSAWDLDIPLDRDRPDVRARHPEAGEAPCGFFFYGRIPEGAPRALVARWAGAAPSVLTRFPATTGWRMRLRSLAALTGRAAALACAGQWQMLWEKVQRRLNTARAPRARLDRATTARLAALALDALVIDHDLGGGANLYRKRWVAERTAAGERIGVLIYSLLRLGFVLTEHSARGNAPLGVFAARDLGRLLDVLAPRRLVYNDAVSHPDALHLAEILADCKRQRREAVQLVLAMHDFFPICPSPHLLDADGSYCGVPEDAGRCAACLERLSEPFVDLYRHHGLPAWRTAWGALLALADEIRIFSPSARTLLGRAYPALEAARIALRPHRVEPLPAAEASRVARWRGARRPTGVIAVVGSITPVKGAHVVARLARWLAERQPGYRLCVIGALMPSAGVPAPFLSETGPYAAHELTSLVLKADPDLFLVPSIVPETFSFVLHELERYGLPIAAFPYGAQADFIARCAHAHALPEAARDDPAALVAALAQLLPVFTESA